MAIRQEEPLLIAEGVGKTFNRNVGQPIQVLQGLDLTVHAGERIAILGKSGAGKSTLLHVLGTLESPTWGTIHFEGKNIFDFNEATLSAFRNRRLGFVFQFHYLMLEFNALENVMMPALLAGSGQSVSRKRAMELLARVGLENRVKHKPGQLSGGEQQRVAIARALMMNPKLLLTDEMTGNLDPATEAHVLELVLDLQNEYKTALISVTHDETLAATFPRVLSLEGGKLKSIQ